MDFVKQRANPEMVSLVRQARKWTQTRLAEAAGLTQPFISRVESGEKDLADDALRAVTEALEVHPDVLMMDEPIEALRVRPLDAVPREQKGITLAAGQIGELPRRRLSVRRNSNEGFLYVIELSTNKTKVGCTTNPFGRIGSHSKEAARYGVEITRVWLSPGHANYKSTEAHLIQAAHQLGGEIVVGRELFSGLSFAAAVEFAQDLDFQPGDVSEEARFCNRSRRSYPYRQG